MKNILHKTRKMTNSENYSLLDFSVTKQLASLLTTNYIRFYQLASFLKIFKKSNQLCEPLIYSICKSTNLNWLTNYI